MKKVSSSGFAPPPYEKAVASALQQLAAGTASPDQQKRALDWIIKQACGTYDQAFRPGGQDGARETDFALGRQFAGQQIVKMLHLNLSVIANRNPNADPPEQR